MQFIKGLFLAYIGDGSSWFSEYKSFKAKAKFKFKHVRILLLINFMEGEKYV